jgi:hypothetical protein
LCKAFFSLFERLLRGCELSWSLATPNLKPIWKSGKFLREGHIHMKDSNASPISSNHRKSIIFQKGWRLELNLVK